MPVLRRPVELAEPKRTSSSWRLFAKEPLTDSLFYKKKLLSSLTQQGFG